MVRWQEMFLSVILLNMKEILYKMFGVVCVALK